MGTFKKSDDFSSELSWQTVIIKGLLTLEPARSKKALTSIQKGLNNLVDQGIISQFDAREFRQEKTRILQGKEEDIMSPLDKMLQGLVGEYISWQEDEDKKYDSIYEFGKIVEVAAPLIKIEIPWRRGVDWLSYYFVVYPKEDPEAIEVINIIKFFLKDIKIATPIKTSEKEIEIELSEILKDRKNEKKRNKAAENSISDSIKTLRRRKAKLGPALFFKRGRY